MSIVVFTILHSIHGFTYKCKRVIPCIRQHLLVSILILLEGDKEVNINNLEASMKGSLKIHEVKTGIMTRGFAIGFMKG